MMNRIGENRRLVFPNHRKKVCSLFLKSMLLTVAFSLMLFDQSDWGSYPLFLVLSVFLLEKDVRFFHMLSLLHLLR